MRVLLLLLPVALAAGCSNADPNAGPVRPHPVSGKVIYDGKPAEGVQVTLYPTDAPMPPQIPQNPHGTTKADGTFAITTFAEGDGAGEGGYMILLGWPRPAGEGDETDETGNDRLLGWYDAKHTKFTARVKAGTNELPVFNLPKKTAPPPPTEGVPGRN